MRFARPIGAERSLFQRLVNKSGDASPHLVSEHRARHNPQRYHRLSRARRRYYASRPPNVTPTDSREEPDFIVFELSKVINHLLNAVTYGLVCSNEMFISTGQERTLRASGKK